MNRKALIGLIAIGTLAVLGALTPEAEPAHAGNKAMAGDIAWLLTASGLVLLMTPGLAFFYGGLVSRKNIISTMLQSFIALGMTSLLWLMVAFSLAFGDSFHGLIGDPRTFFMFKGVSASATHTELSPTVPLLLYALFQLKFAIITPALITGAFAERIRFSGYLIFMCLFTVFVYAPLAHWTWHPNGVFHRWGVLDFAGGTVVHLAAGCSALAGALALGRRSLHRAKHPHTQVPGNIIYVMLGTGMLWFGWFGFNAGSALAASEDAVLAFATTNTASGAAMLTWLFVDRLQGRLASALGACTGAVVGLVAITPAAGFVSVGQSICIGAVAAVICNVVANIKAKTVLDDTLDVFPVHGIGGLVGMLATGLLAKKVGLIHGSGRTFGYHCLALVITIAYTFTVSYAMYRLTSLLVPLRVTPEEEERGLDLSQHGESIEVQPDPDHPR
jgi:Amt family ammonium transporter